MLGRTALITMAFGTAAGAQELPATERLQTLVADKLPSYWTINDLSVVTTSREGDAAQPKAIMRFEATATAEGALFAATGEEGPFVLVSETYGAEEERTLYGFAELSYSAGEWGGGVTIENPVTELGQPSDYFPRPTLVAGTEEAEQKLDALHSLNVGIAAGANAVEMQRIERQHQEAVSELKAHQTEALAELETQHANELADAKSAAQQELASIERKYEERIASLKESKEPMVAEAKAERAQALKEQREKTEQQLEDFREQQQAELNELRADADSRKQELAALERQYQEQIADLKQSKEPMVAELRAERAELLSQEREETEQALQELRQAQRAKIEALKANQAERRGELIAQQEQELGKLEKRLSTEAESLQEQLASSQEIVQLQEALTASLDKRATGAEEMLKAFEEARLDRKEVLSNLPKSWAGQTRCITSQDGEDEETDTTRPIFIRIDEIDSGGATGYLGSRQDSWGHNNRYSSPITMVMTEDDVRFPLKMRVTSSEGFERRNGDLTIRYVFDATIKASGIMVASPTFNWQNDGHSWTAECTLRLSG